MNSDAGSEIQTSGTGRQKQRLIVGISGASGVILGIRLLQVLKETSVDTHLIVSPAAEITISQETDWSLAEITGLAKAVYESNDVGAPPASGSFVTLGMIVIPCSIKTLSAIANGYSADLIARAADVTLKEGRELILVVRETPLHAGHIHLMDLAVKAGAVIFPPVPAFYARPKSVDELIDHTVGRVFTRFGIENDLFPQWGQSRLDETGR
jgi:4-hydroxy-3-polyprenylbenzoate decarboxylase